MPKSENEIVKEIERRIERLELERKSVPRHAPHNENYLFGKICTLEDIKQWIQSDAPAEGEKRE